MTVFSVLPLMKLGLVNRQGRGRSTSYILATKAS
jgi:hypothetical protein